MDKIFKRLEWNFYRFDSWKESLDLENFFPIADEEPKEGGADDDEDDDDDDEEDDSDKLDKDTPDPAVEPDPGVEVDFEEDLEEDLGEKPEE